MWQQLSPKMVRAYRMQFIVQAVNLAMVFGVIATFELVRRGQAYDSLFIVILVVNLGSMIPTFYKPVEWASKNELNEKYKDEPGPIFEAETRLGFDNIDLDKDQSYLYFEGDVLRVRGIRQSYDLARAEVVSAEGKESFSLQLLGGLTLKIIYPKRADSWREASFKTSLDQFLDSKAITPAFDQATKGEYREAPYETALRRMVIGSMMVLAAYLLYLATVFVTKLPEGWANAGYFSFSLVLAGLLIYGLFKDKGAQENKRQLIRRRFQSLG